MKTVLKHLLLVVALPIALAVAFYTFLLGCQAPICDPVHTGKEDPNSGSNPSTQPTRPHEPHPPVCDPVHVPPPPPGKQ